jgi:hypothetical protein
VALDIPAKAVLDVSEDDFFIVAGLGADAGDDLGEPGLDLCELLANPDEHRVFEEFQEIDLGPDAGELAAVVPPEEALERWRDLAPRTRKRVAELATSGRSMRPWLGAAIAAAALAGIGGTLGMLGRQESGARRVAHSPSPPPPAALAASLHQR